MNKLYLIIKAQNFKLHLQRLREKYVKFLRRLVFSFFIAVTLYMFICIAGDFFII